MQDSLSSFSISIGCLIRKAYEKYKQIQDKTYVEQPITSAIQNVPKRGRTGKSLIHIDK